MVGEFSHYNGTNGLNRIVRLNSNGSLDTSFDTGIGFNNNVNAIAPADHHSGSVYVAGQFSSFDGTSVGRIVRLDDTGNLDTNFAAGAGFNSHVYSLAFANNGSNDIYAGGVFTDYDGTPINRIARINGDGTIDTAFAIGNGYNQSVNSLAPVASGSGQLYVGGYFTAFAGSGANRGSRLNSNGTLDVSFIPRGSAFDEEVFALEPVSDGTGDIYAGGFFRYYRGAPASYLVRLNGDGTLDTGFSGADRFSNAVLSIAAARDGSGDVYAGGWFTQYGATSANYIARLNSNGSLDGGFDFGSGFNGTTSSLLTTQNGSGDLYVGGHFSSYNGSTAQSIVRLNSDGSIDTGFATGSGFDDEVLEIKSAADGSGDIYVAGYFSNYDGNVANQIVRLNSDGTLDSGFNAGAGTNGEVYALAAANDGSGDIYLGGNFSDYDGSSVANLIRLNSDGSLDTGFDTGTGLDSDVESIDVATDGSGRLYVGGFFDNYDGTLVSYGMRLNSDGSLDSSFAMAESFDESAYVVRAATDGSNDVFFGGSFSRYQTSTANRIVRLDSSGALRRVSDGRNGSVSYR